MENNPHMPSLTGPPTIPTYRIAVRGNLLGQSTLAYFFYTAAVGAAPLTNPALLIETWWAFIDDFWVSAVSQDWSVTTILCRRVDLYGQVTRFRTQSQLLALGNSVTGARGVSCPPQDAVCVKKTTTTVGKRGRGRWFFGGVAEADQTSGVLDALPLANFTALASSLTTPLEIEGSGYNPAHCFWEEFPSETDPTTGLVTLEGGLIDQTSADPVIRSQRRRQIGRGI